MYSMEPPTTGPNGSKKIMIQSPRGVTNSNQNQVFDNSSTNQSSNQLSTAYSATKYAARSIAAEDRAGILQPGRAADILVVEGNPLIDLNVLWNVKAVYKAGKRVVRDQSQNAYGARGVL